MAAAAPTAAAERYEDGLAAYQHNEFEKSLKLLRPLAEKGDARAQYLLGRQHQFGQGVKADRGEAFYWYKRAEAKGHLEAKLFRQLLEKRWKITAEERESAERRHAPKPTQVARAETKPGTGKPAVEALQEKIKPAESAKPQPPKVEAARAKLPEKPKPETAKAKLDAAKPPREKSSIVTAMSKEPPPTVLRGKTEYAKVPPRPQMRDIDDDDGVVAQLRDRPPAETRTAVAAAPNYPPPSDDYNAAPPAYAPPGAPYYGPAPYYAPAPPSARASVYYAPRAYYRANWGYRPYAGYAYQGWRGRRW